MVRPNLPFIASWGAMNDLKDKVRTALNEARILVLGIEVLVGFDFEAVFQKNFVNLPAVSQDLKIISLLLLLVALGLTMAPAAFHQIVEHGAENPRCLSFVTAVMGMALLPFAIGLGAEIYIAVQQVAGILPGIVAGAVTICLAVALWYGIEWLQRLPPQEDELKDRQNSGAQASKGQGPSMQSNNQPTPLKDKIEFVLTETRVVLPGAQALLGFQVVIMLTDAFDKLDPFLKYLHLASLFAVAITMTMLMAPAAYHRLADRGHNTERLHSFASAMVLGSMFFLGLGIVGDLYIVVNQVTNSGMIALVCCGLMLLFFYGLWFGYSLLKRDAPNEQTKDEEHPQKLEVGS